MVRCTKCGAAMVRVDLYEPEGTIPLHGGIQDNTYWWVCINGECEDGKRNRMVSKEQIQLI